MHGLGWHRRPLDHDRRNPQVATSRPGFRRRSLGCRGDLSFVQISDSHIGFNKEANKDVAATLREAVAKINALPKAPSFMLHTGDLTHLSEAEEFDTLDQILKGCKTRQVFYVPGEHDVINDNGSNIVNVSAKDPRVRVGTASTRRECISSGWLMSWISKKADLAFSDTSNWNGWKMI